MYFPSTQTYFWVNSWFLFSILFQLRTDTYVRNYLISHRQTYTCLQLFTTYRNTTQYGNVYKQMIVPSLYISTWLFIWWQVQLLLSFSHSNIMTLLISLITPPPFFLVRGPGRPVGGAACKHWIFDEQYLFSRHAPGLLTMCICG